MAEIEISGFGLRKKRGDVKFGELKFSEGYSHFGLLFKLSVGFLPKILI